jgi:hypothetical protein
MDASPITRERCVVRKTNAHMGRFLAVVPGKTAVEHLHYGRIILGGTDVPVRFSTDGHETALIVLKGGATVETPKGLSSLGRFDALYIPRDCEVEVRPTADGCDIAEVAAPVARKYPERLVRFEEIQKDPALHFKAGGPGTERDLNILIGKNVEAGRILAGVTFSAPGNWTSWPPHEHSAMLEEAYLYFDMPARLHRPRGARACRRRPRRGRGHHASGLSPERRRARRVDQLPLDDGRPSRGRRPAVRGGQRPAGLRRQGIGSRGLAQVGARLVSRRQDPR